MKNHQIVLMIIIGQLILTDPAVAVLVNQLDDFETGTTVGWSGGKFGLPPTVIQSGGPTGFGDGYLQIDTVEFHLGTKNETQWTGNFLAQNINAIELDMLQFPSSNNGDQAQSAPDPGPAPTLTFRVLLFGPGGVFASKLTQNINPSAWSHHQFGLTEVDLYHVQDGTGLLNDTLADVTKLLIRNDRPVATLPGNHPPHITARLGLDNIHAIPEPATMGLFFVGSLVLVRRKNAA